MMATEIDARIELG